MTGLELDLHGTWRGHRDIVDALSSDAELARVYPSPRLLQDALRSLFLMLDEGENLRHVYDHPIVVRLRVPATRDALSLTISGAERSEA
jgi:hypothetical protein